MTEFEHQSVDASHTVPKFDRWVVLEGMYQARKNFGVVVLATFLHFTASVLFKLLQVDGPLLQQLSGGSTARYVVLETIVAVIAVIPVLPVLMATHVSLINGISNWAAIASKPLKEWDRFVGVIVFWVIGIYLISALPKFWPSSLTIAFSISVLAVFSILIATWMPAVVYSEKVSFRRVLARGRKTFWYVFSRLIIFILFVLLVSVVSLVILTPVVQVMLSKVEAPGLIIFIVNNGGTAIITSCVAPILSVIFVRAYILGEACLNSSSDQEVAEKNFIETAD